MEWISSVFARVLRNISSAPRFHEWMKKIDYRYYSKVFKSVKNTFREIYFSYTIHGSRGIEQSQKTHARRTPKLTLNEISFTIWYQIQKTNLMEYDGTNNFRSVLEPNGTLFGSNIKGKLSLRSCSIELERKLVLWV